MTAATEMGAIVSPPVPPFYHVPQTLEAMVDQMARRALDPLRLAEVEPAAAWLGLASPRPERNLR
jgi:4-hydroxy-3-polyprenylbenzoate decarboxylase